MIIAIDVGGETIRAGAFEVPGTPILLKTSQTGAARAEVISNVKRLVASVREGLPPPVTLDAIVIGFPGLISSDGERLIGSNSIPGFVNENLARTFRQELDCLAPLLMMNDGNAAAVGECTRLNADTCDPCAVVCLGSGIGGGILINGQLYRGSIGSAAAFGHISVSSTGEVCRCGNIGCLELYASGRAISKQAIHRGLPVASSAAVFDLAVAGNAVAQSLFQDVGIALGMALTTIYNVLNCRKVLITGGVSEAWPAFSTSMFKYVEAHCCTYSFANSAALKGTFAGLAGVHGAATVAFQLLKIPERRGDCLI